MRQTKSTKEYLRRNLLLANAVGILSQSKNVEFRIEHLKSPPVWLLDYLDDTIAKLELITAELAKHRDAVTPLDAISDGAVR